MAIEIAQPLTAGHGPPAHHTRKLESSGRPDEVELSIGEVAPNSLECLDEAIADCDFGAWSGRTLADVNDADPEAVRAWMLDPESAPHGGESLAVFCARIGRWLDGQATQDGRLAAVTHAEVVKAAIVHALGAPPAAFWRIDAAPLAVSELHAHDGRWTIARLNCPF